MISYKIPCRGEDGMIQWVEIKGEEIDLESGRFAVDHRKAPIGEWVVTELKTGLSVCVGATKEEAVGKLRAMMADSECRWAVEELIRRWSEADG